MRRLIVGEQSLDDYLRNNLALISEAKNKGVKVVGYFPGNYVPVEIIHAAGAIPICLFQGGDSASVNVSSSLIPEHFCPFARAQIGETILNKNPYYQMIDLLVTPTTCQHLRKVAEILEYYDNIEIFKLGVPHEYDNDIGLEYFAHNLLKLQRRLQQITGNKINFEQIYSSTNLYNTIRRLLRKISLMRRSSPPALSGSQFIKLNHASFFIPPETMINILQSTYENIERKQRLEKQTAPRILLMGPNVAHGDYKVLELIEDTGADIVVEEVCEGVRDYWQDIVIARNPVQSLAESYLQHKPPCAFMWRSTRNRFTFAQNLITDFNVSGIIWYQLLCCETYDAESFYFGIKLENLKLPMLTLESDYTISNHAPLKIRIDAFVEMITGDIDYD
jgi:benzoyl-CoA reductase/2-hydroxyglutaryl-CoA dehydratase subunit BcrC/BadD/HgdB